MTSAISPGLLADRLNASKQKISAETDLKDTQVIEAVEQIPLRTLRAIETSSVDLKLAEIERPRAIFISDNISDRQAGK
jgi:hypothetical protein